MWMTVARVATVTAAGLAGAALVRRRRRRRRGRHGWNMGISASVTEVRGEADAPEALVYERRGATGTVTLTWRDGSATYERMELPRGGGAVVRARGVLHPAGPGVWEGRDTWASSGAYLHAWTLRAP